MSFSTNKSVNLKRTLGRAAVVSLFIGVLGVSSAMAHVVKEPPKDPPPVAPGPPVVGDGGNAPPVDGGGGAAGGGGGGGGGGSTSDPSPGGNSSGDPSTAGLSFQGDSIPEIDRMADGEEKLEAMMGALGQMMQAIDPDLRTGSGRRASARALADHYESRFSDPQAVRDALEIAEQVTSAAPASDAAVVEEAVSSEDIRIATMTFELAALELRDDVPSRFSEAAFHNPTMRIIWWLLAGLGAVFTCIGIAWHRRSHNHSLAVSR